MRSLPVLGRVLQRMRRRSRGAVAPDSPLDAAASDADASATDTVAFRSFGRLADRALAPLVPAFHAMSATWPAEMPPDRVLRTVLLMAAIAPQGTSSLAARATGDSALRGFLRLPQHATLDEDGLRRGQERLVGNVNAREAVRAFVETARREGLFDQDGFIENAGVIHAWTAPVPG